jgi:hypothetical protein
MFSKFLWASSTLYNFFSSWYYGSENMEVAKNEKEVEWRRHCNEAEIGRAARIHLNLEKLDARVNSIGFARLMTQRRALAFVNEVEKMTYKYIEIVDLQEFPIDQRIKMRFFRRAIRELAYSILINVNYYVAYRRAAPNTRSVSLCDDLMRIRGAHAWREASKVKILNELSCIDQREKE